MVPLSHSLLTTVRPVATGCRGPESRPGTTAGRGVVDIEDKDTVPVVTVALEPDGLSCSRLGVISADPEAAVLPTAVHAEGGSGALVDVLHRPSTLIGSCGKGESAKEVILGL